MQRKDLAVGGNAKKKKKENVLINYFKKDRLVVTQREHMVSLPLSAPGS